MILINPVGIRSQIEHDSWRAKYVMSSEWFPFGTVRMWMNSWNSLWRWELPLNYDLDVRSGISEQVLSVLVPDVAGIIVANFCDDISPLQRVCYRRTKRNLKYKNIHYVIANAMKLVYKYTNRIFHNSPKISL